MNEYKYLGIRIEKHIQRLMGLEFNQDNCDNMVMLSLKSSYSEDCIKDRLDSSITAAIACYLARHHYDESYCKRALPLLENIEGKANLIDLTEEQISEILEQLNKLV